MAREVRRREVTVSQYPCVHIAYYATLPCPDHALNDWCPDRVVQQHGDGFGVPVADGGRSCVEIAFCPWCGSSLSPSQ